MAGKKGAGKGIPKSAEQKQKMSEAHSGKPKSIQHKLSLSTSQQQRWDRIHSIMEETGANYAAAKGLYKLEKNIA